MRLKIITSTLTILLATSGSCLLFAESEVCQEQISLEEFTPHERKALQMLIKLAAPAIAPFSRPISHGFVELAIPAAAVGLFGAKTALGKLNPLGAAIKASAFGVAFITVWKTLHATFGSADATTGKAMQETYKARSKTFKTTFDPQFKAFMKDAKELSGRIAALAKQLPKEERIDKAGKAITATVDKLGVQLTKETGRQTLGLTDKRSRPVTRSKSSQGDKVVSEVAEIRKRMVAMRQGGPSSVTQGDLEVCADIDHLVGLLYPEQESR